MVPHPSGAALAPGPEQTETQTSLRQVRLAVEGEEEGVEEHQLLLGRLLLEVQVAGWLGVQDF